MKTATHKGPQLGGENKCMFACRCTVAEDVCVVGGGGVRFEESKKQPKRIAV